MSRADILQTHAEVGMQRETRRRVGISARFWLAALAFILSVASARAGWAQTAGPGAATARPAFDVASVRLNTRGGPSMMMTPHDRFTATNMPLNWLIRMAYGVRDDQMMGGPAWIYRDRYDIEATGNGLHAPAASGPTDKPAHLMVQSLLEDRFKLKVHREVREAAVYELRVAKGGLKMPPQPAGSCVDMWKPGAMVPGGPPQVYCDDWQKSRTGLLVGTGITMATVGDPSAGLVAALTQIVGRTVIDKTGLTGAYEVHLEWTPDMAGGSDAPGNAMPAEDAGPSIFTAVKEQLGLELKAAKGPVTTLVVDSVERPSAN